MPVIRVLVDCFKFSDVFRPGRTLVACGSLPIASEPVAASETSFPLAPSINSPGGEQIRTLAIRVTTSGDFLSGTDDDVWIDIGPKAWKIGNNFPAGGTKTLYIDITNPHGDEDTPSVVPLYVDDISQVRLEKKGICGLTDAPDSLFDPTIASGVFSIDPSNPLASFQAQVRAAQTLMDEQKEIVDAQGRLIDEQLKIIKDAQAVIDHAADLAANGPRQFAELQNQIVGLQNQLAQTVKFVTNNVCHPEQKTVQRVIGGLFGGVTGVLITETVCNNVTTVNDAWQRLTNNISQLQTASNDLQADMASIAVRKAAALQSKAVAESTEAAAILKKNASEGAYAAARQALDQAKNVLDAAQQIVNKLPHFDWSKFVPHPGAWKVDGFTLVVNGRDFATFAVNDTLMRGHSSWTGFFKKLSPDEEFARALRVNLNRQNSNLDEEIARLTTIFKDLNISGWRNGPVSAARVVGKLQYAPSDSRDGFATLDLELERIESRGVAYVLDEKHGIRHKRYFRIEYRRRRPDGTDDQNFKSWKPGVRLAVEGSVLWDTDRYGFYEIHPSPSQISVLRPGDDGASSKVGLWWDGLWAK